MRGLVPALSFLATLAPAQAPVLKAAASLPLQGHALSPGASLLVSPDRLRVIALDDERLQLWDGRGGEVLKSTLPTVPLPGAAVLEEGSFILDSAGCARSVDFHTEPIGAGPDQDPPRPTLFSPPPPETWDGAAREFQIPGWLGSRKLNIDDGRLVSKSDSQGSEAVGRGCRLRVDGREGLRVLFVDDRDWRMAPRNLVRVLPASPQASGLSLEPSCYSLVALAPDGSRVAAIWSPLELRGDASPALRRGPSRLLVWRRGDHLPSLDLPWEGQDPWSLQFTPSGKALMAAMGTELLVLDPDTGRESAVIPTEEGPACWVPGEDRAVFTLDRKNGTYALWDLAWGEEVKRFRMPGASGSGAGENLLAPEAISPDGRWIAALWNAERILLFELES